VVGRRAVFPAPRRRRRLACAFPWLFDVAVAGTARTPPPGWPRRIPSTLLILGPWCCPNIEGSEIRPPGCAGGEPGSRWIFSCPPKGTPMTTKVTRAHRSAGDYYMTQAVRPGRNWARPGSATRAAPSPWPRSRPNPSWNLSPTSPGTRTPTRIPAAAVGLIELRRPNCRLLRLLQPYYPGPGFLTRAQLRTTWWDYDFGESSHTTPYRPRSCPASRLQGRLLPAPSNHDLPAVPRQSG